MKRKCFFSYFLLLVSVCLFSLFPDKVISQQIETLQKLRNYLTENKARLGISPDDISSLSLTREYKDDAIGFHHIYATQKINGITVTNSNFALHSIGNKSFDVNQLVSSKKYVVQDLKMNVTANDAILKLMETVQYSGPKSLELKEVPRGEDKVTIFKRGNSDIWDIPCRLVYYNNSKAKLLQPAWEVQMMDMNKKHYWLSYISLADGKILEKRDLILHCRFDAAETDAHVANHANHAHGFVDASLTNNVKNIDGTASPDYFAIPSNTYRVFDLPFENPIDPGAAQTIGSKSGDTLASPDAWHRVAGALPYQYTRGNNVWAYYDPTPAQLGGAPSADPLRTAYNNGGVGGTPVPNEPFVFDYPINLSNEPDTYQKAAIVNLFYWNNLMHDVFYYMGFNEASGNFQESHIFSGSAAPRGGAAGQGDAVQAQAQDGGGTNNANFLTLTDGAPGSAQMQMYLWTGSFPEKLVQITSSTSGIPPGGTKYTAIQGSFNTAPTDTANNDLYRHPVVDRQMVLVKKNPSSTVGRETEGCSTGQQSIALPPGNDVQNKIVLIDRGSCSFVEKIVGAQEGGAAGVIIINNVDGPPIVMGGTDAPSNVIRIPAVMISKADGDVLKAQLQAAAMITGSLKRDNPQPPKRDGDIDNGIIAHEYGHGISNRLTGGPMTTLPLGGDEQGGEGWSDFFALYMTLRPNDLSGAAAGHPNGVLPNRSIGNYVTYQPYDGRGIREYPYSTDMNINPATFGYVKRPDYSETHSVGFVWCSMLYELMQSFIDLYGINDNVYDGAQPVNNQPPASAKGNNIATRLVVEALKLQPTSPTFIEQRDAILKADSALYNHKHSCLIWAAFAKRGLGASAVSGTNALGDEFESFDVPFRGCDATQKRISIVKTGPIKVVNGTEVSYTLKVTNKYDTTLSGLAVYDTLPASLTYKSASDNPVITNTNQIGWTLNLLPNETRNINVVTQLNSFTASTQSFGDDHETSATNWVPANTGGSTTWTYSNNASQAYSGSKYWFAPNSNAPLGAGTSNTTLTSANLITIPANAELVFIHKFATEQDFDGGVLEVREKDSLNWKYIPASKFARGGYSGVIATADNPGIGTADLAAFTGASDGYITSVAKLEDFAGKDVNIRFRFTCDAATTVPNGGWWLDDVYLLLNRTEVTNSATAITNPGAPVLQTEGANATSSLVSFILGGNVYPSGLGDLTGSWAGNKVSLQWKTFNETNAAVFEIERKGINDASFAKIGTVVPGASPAQATIYNFNDVNITLGNKYQYRVRLVTKAGESRLTNIAVVNLSAKSFEAEVYPNPARQIANLSIFNPDGGKVTIHLFDVLGKKLATFIGAEAQSQVIPMHVSGLKAGTYWIEVNTTENHKTLKLIIR